MIEEGVGVSCGGSDVIVADPRNKGLEFGWLTERVQCPAHRKGVQLWGCIHRGLLEAMLQPPKKTLFTFAHVLFQAHTLRSPFRHNNLGYASERGKENNLQQLDETPKWSRHRCHVGAIAITEGEYGEQEIHLAADHDAAQKDVRQGVVDLEKKFDKAGEEKQNKSVEDKWHSIRNGTKPETEYALKQITADPRSTLWR